MRKSKKWKIRKEVEIFEGKYGRCLNCKKTIKHGDECLVARRIKDGKVIARHCSKDCDDEYQASRLTCLGGNSPEDKL